MTVVNETATVRPEVTMYERYAELETTAGYDAWNSGNYHRAIKLWKLAARWSQEAVKASIGGAQ